MNVLFVSQCTKRALTETRRILDQFAERRGDRTWQTPITQAGLDTVRKLLRQSARKNTAVACHWIRGKDHSELLWVIGDGRQFNAEGAVPTNATESDVLRVEDENNWHNLRLIQQLAALAALLHDIGKASDAFQDRLEGKFKGKNLYRHEWTSVRMFQAFVTSCGDEANDQLWLQCLAECADLSNPAQWEQRWQGSHLLRDGITPSIPSESNPLKVLPSLARAVAWLILTHHRLPALPNVKDSNKLWHGQTFKGMGVGDVAHALGKINAEWNEPYSADQRRAQPENLIQPYWTFSKGLPITTQAWRKRAARMAQSLLKTTSGRSEQPLGEAGVLDDAFVMHLARLSLMLGDHYYSSLEDEHQRFKGNADCKTFANTDHKSGERLQKLDEHLLGVESHASQIGHALPSLARQLAHLKGHRRLKMRSQNDLFHWQDKAADLAASMRHCAAEHGAFIVNMASTGCGKTLGNARIMNALANPATGMRCAFAIGLRALTLQTGRSFQRDLSLGEDELAIQVGGTASRELFEYYEALNEKTGSASRQDLLDETTHVVFEGNDSHPVLQHLVHDRGARKLLAAPLLVCTVDHLTPATESLRGGRQIAPMLRLMTGDLVLDEPDDFDMADLPALTRLVHWAGLLGSRVLLSSATLPPALVNGLFMAYLEGRRTFQKNRGERPREAPRVACLWVDEFNHEHAECADAQAFTERHEKFAVRREAELGQQMLCRRAQLLPLPAGFQGLNKEQRRSALAELMRNTALTLHQGHYSIDPHSVRNGHSSPKRISFGLIRMANIGPLFDVALTLFQHGAPAGTRIHLCVYHSQFPLFVRSAIERRLDTTLNRRDENAVFDLPEIRQAIDTHGEQDQIFIALCSPVCEVGRDWDADWAVAEPSSMRSLIQLAGRVLRHRTHRGTTKPNLLILNTNLKHFDEPGRPAFCKPGFEGTGEFALEPHHTLDHLLSHLLDVQQQMPIDARPRIVARDKARRNHQGNLVDLEHERMEDQMQPPLPVASAANPAPSAPAQQNRLRRSAVASIDALSAGVDAMPPASVKLNASSFWHRKTIHLTGALQQAQPFRHDTQTRVDVVLLPTEDEDDYKLYRISEGEKKWEHLYVEWEGRNARIPDAAVTHPQISPWGMVDFMTAMRAQAEDMGLPLTQFAEKFATASLTTKTNNNQGWYWHPWLGFRQKG